MPGDNDACWTSHEHIYVYSQGGSNSHTCKRNRDNVDTQGGDTNMRQATSVPFNIQLPRRSRSTTQTNGTQRFNLVEDMPPVQVKPLSSIGLSGGA